ncbi:DUF4362 domain-containing protein [Solibacillus sp. MA9]|uniref:DUF4362 domain-containing protein n=1 Tax=Solibacillus palustris TaxID=2908203 RepID=A0ABS9UDX6_9BACL|nr:DUF4362 domain-containing protein [Solibacillus sp. MA9]MCH7322537.1 DUF4362 domain-containing protein [Solibacillus sp. MA9]
MKKWLLLLGIMLLVACSDKEPINEIKRVQLEKVNTPEEIQVFEQPELAFISEQLQKVKWQPNVKAEMARIEDIQLQLFIEREPNMPEYIITYRIWIEKNQSLTIISSDEKEGYGRLDSKKAKPLVKFLFEKMDSLKPVIDKHGQIENGEVFEQFVQQVNNKKPASVNITHYTIEGDPIYYRTDYDGTKFHLEIDKREDKFGNGGFEYYSCEVLTDVHNGELLEYYLSQCEDTEAKLHLLVMPFNTDNEQFTKSHLPEMSLTIGERALAVQKGAYSWTLPTNNHVEMMTISVDHAAPNQMVNMANGVKVDKFASRNIQFEVEPSRVEYRVWNDEKMLGTYPSLKDIDTSEPFILEVFAYWCENYASYVTAMQFE